MTPTVAEALSDLRQEVHAGFARLEERLSVQPSEAGVRELEAYLQGVAEARLGDTDNASR